MFKKCKLIIVTTISFKKFKLHKSQNSAPPFRLIIVIENSLGVHEFDFFPEPLQFFFIPIHTLSWWLNPFIPSVALQSILFLA
jgi:hypothetical protein